MTVKTFAAAFAVAGLLAAPSAFAQQPTAPGQLMHQKGSVEGSAGASGYAPGHKMQTKGSVKGTVGASGYAPGRVDADTKANADVKGSAGRTSIDADVKGSVNTR